MKTIILLFIPVIIFSQSKFEDKLEQTYQYAKKGIYFALSNIPDKKSNLNENLVDNDKLICEVKLSKEINGVKITSKGIFETYETEIVVYKSYGNLVKEGYLKELPK